MGIISMVEAKSKLSRLVEQVESGQVREIVIARNGRPGARLVPLHRASAGKRLGVAKGCFVLPDCIDRANAAVTERFGQPWATRESPAAATRSS